MMPKTGQQIPEVLEGERKKQSRSRHANPQLSTWKRLWVLSSGWRRVKRDAQESATPRTAGELCGAQASEDPKHPYRTWIWKPPSAPSKAGQPDELHNKLWVQWQTSVHTCVGKHTGMSASRRGACVRVHTLKRRAFPKNTSFHSIWQRKYKFPLLPDTAFFFRNHERKLDCISSHLKKLKSL